MSEQTAESTISKFKKFSGNCCAYRDTIVGHVSPDSTAIKAREKPAPKRKRGRPKKGEKRPKEPSRLERQLAKMKASMKASVMAAEPPSACDVGAKRNAKGHLVSWTG